MMLITSSVLFVLLSFASCQNLGGHGPGGSDTHTHSDVPNLSTVLDNLGDSSAGTGGSSASSSGGVPDIASIDVNVVEPAGGGVPDLADSSSVTSDQGLPPSGRRSSGGGFDGGQAMGDRMGGGSGFDRRSFNQRGMDPRDFRRFDRDGFGRGSGFTDTGRMDRGRPMGRDGPTVPYFMGGEPGGPGRRDGGPFFDGPGPRLRGGMDPDFGLGMRPADRRGLGDRGFGGPRSDPRGGMRDMGPRGFDSMDRGRFRDTMGRQRFESMGPGRFDGMRSGRMPDMGPGMGLGPDRFTGSSRRSGSGFDGMGGGLDRRGSSFDGMGGGLDRRSGSFDGMGGGLDRRSSSFDGMAGGLDRRSGGFDGMGGGLDRRGGGSGGPMDRAGGMMTGGSGMPDSMGGGFFNESSGMSMDMGGRGRDMGRMSGGDRRGMEIYPGMDGRSSGMRYEPRFAMDPRFTGEGFSRFPDMSRMGGGRGGDFSRGSFPPEYSPYGFSSRMSRFASFGSPVSAPYPTSVPPYGTFSGGVPITTMF